MPEAGRLDHPRPLATPDRVARPAPPGWLVVDRAVRIHVHRGAQRQRIDRPVIADEVLIEWRLVQDVPRADDDVPAQAESVLEGDLAGRHVDDGLHPVPVRPDLRARRDTVELDVDGHAGSDVNSVRVSRRRRPGRGRLAGPPSPSLPRRS